MARADADRMEPTTEAQPEEEQVTSVRAVLHWQIELLSQVVEEVAVFHRQPVEPAEDQQAQTEPANALRLRMVVNMVTEVLNLQAAQEETVHGMGARMYIPEAQEHLEPGEDAVEAEGGTCSEQEAVADITAEEEVVDVMPDMATAIVREQVRPEVEDLHMLVLYQIPELLLTTEVDMDK